MSGAIKEVSTKEQEQRNGVSDGTYQYPRLKFSPASTSAADYPPHERVINRIPNSGYQKYGANDSGRNAYYIGVIIHQIHIDDANSKVLTKCPKSQGQFCGHRYTHETSN
ncbi:hypothetical protein D3C84_912330 [compost metagenome]